MGLERRARDPEKTRAHILDVAFNEISSRGFQGVSLNEIIERTDVTKGAFFHHFSTKQDLGYALVDEVLHERILDMWIKPLAAYSNPVQGILRNLKKVIDSLPDQAIAAGCPLNNLTQEMAGVDPIFQQKLRAITGRWIDEIEAYLQLAQTRGYLRKDTDLRQLAEFIVTMHEGSIGLAKAMRDKGILHSTYDSLRLHLRSLST